MTTRTPSGLHTLASLLELIQQAPKADLLDGAIYMASPENVEHNELPGWLHRVLGTYVEERGLGWVTVNKAVYRPADKNAPEPDLGFVRADRENIVRRSYVDDAPDVAAELDSFDSVDRDCYGKRQRYEQAGVQESWILDPDESRATSLRLGPPGFAEVPLDDHVFRCKAISGFAIEARRSWRRPLPHNLGIVQHPLSQKGEESNP